MKTGQAGTQVGGALSSCSLFVHFALFLNRHFKKSLKTNLLYKAVLRQWTFASLRHLPATHLRRFKEKNPTLTHSHTRILFIGNTINCKHVATISTTYFQSKLKLLFIYSFSLYILNSFLEPSTFIILIELIPFFQFVMYYIIRWQSNRTNR